MSVRTLPRLVAGVGNLVSRGGARGPRLPKFFMLPRDIGLFVKSARTDAQVARLSREAGPKAAFEAAYRDSPDPWASASPRYRYQELKYDRLMALLPKRRFAKTLDLGCGLGLLSQRLATRSDHVLGMDIASSAIEHARRRGAAVPNLSFEAGDILNLPATLTGKFDLVVVADVLYYLSPLDDAVLNSVVRRIAELLSPGGICLLANHFFFSADPESRLSREIHNAFANSRRLSVLSQHHRAFFLATLFSEHSNPISAG
jgi:2-polyprenyl-3-methyl-5-hydroxy-6-metoxy-1,4-benzoquinol methylase